MTTPPPSTPEKLAVPGLGQIVHYTLTEIDASVITTRRERARQASGEPPHPPATGGADVHTGDVYAATVVRVRSLDGEVNLQVLLDGDDAHWVEGASEGPGRGHWQWPAP